VVHLYASWNGATGVAGWGMLAGVTPGALARVGGANKRGFETQIAAHVGLPYLAVQALDARGRVLSTSLTKAIGNHIGIFGASAFVAANRTVGLPAIY
jgi:hypothetical protein